MDNTTFNAEFAQCLFRYNALKEQVANAIETYSHLVDTQGPNIETQYMMLVGQYEIHAMRLEIEVKRWKRRITLRQQYVNRGEKPDMVAIEAQLDEEFAEWQKKLEGPLRKSRIPSSSGIWRNCPTRTRAPSAATTARR